MTIVITRPRKRPKPAQPAEIKVPRIVQHTPRGRAWKVLKPLPPDPEAEARGMAFLERMGIKRPEKASEASATITQCAGREA